ncbi:MAG TPA: LacI family DNA-binding transcriptional regulator [Devosia sp.]|jgi:DNA-binding LacI/PurR family transcriptional regulator|uniref:LacI family DNA-binding transcriptional regulator n=1 Tax=Devosia sp. TaxID=1871048 RepID=UPI002DDCBDAB|nr:LacI family DNA-binding transcriptional regulator [Devosia sp.]HEV2514578.1 LacI family DNA-binding transcriptional regulator [Devosia sp.]
MSTISKVAERAGVSRTTVSHVINHASRVSKPLREKVQAAIDELGYSPNPQAKSLRTGRTNLIAVLIPDIGNPFYTELVKAAQAALEEAGLDALIYNTDVPGGNWQTHGRDYLRQLNKKRVDGLLVGDFALHGINEELQKLDTPVVFIGQLASHAVDSVKVDDYGGGYMVGKHFAERGHKTVVQITGPENFESAMARADGFEQALRDHKVKVRKAQRYTGSYLPPSGREAAQWIAGLRGEDKPSAVFIGNYLMAMGALAEFHDQGVRVPDDIAVAIFGDLPQLEYVRPNLTRAGENPGALARRAVEMLLDRLNGKFDGPPRTEVIPCALRIFESA